MMAEGTDMIDIGGYSSRPGAPDIPMEEELKRILPSVDKIIKFFPEIILSVDTFRSEVARRAVEAGAAMINDISGGSIDPAMIETIADLKVPYVLMHMQGTPQNMNSFADYENIFNDISIYLNRRINELKEKGVYDIIIDPGFGFAKTVPQNYDLLKNLTYFEVIGYPILVGISRKSMIHKPLDIDSSESLNGTSVLNTIALIKKASILRVHDVKEAKEVIDLVRISGI
jgi:dihydropteroate synthase